MNGNSAFIRLKRVSKSYAADRFTALNEVDLSIRQGEHVVITGKSGSGKSTLLNILSGIDYPTRGTVTVGRTELNTLTESGLAAWRGKNIGIVFQFFQLIPTLTIMENLLLAMDFVNKIPRAGRRKRAEDLLEMIGIAAQARKFPAALSGGEQQRAAIARALANDPPILIADEPTGNLDSKTTNVILDLFAGLVGSGKTVIMVTHEDVSSLEYDRKIILIDGSVADQIITGRSRGKVPHVY